MVLAGIILTGLLGAGLFMLGTWLMLKDAARRPSSGLRGTVTARAAALFAASTIAFFSTMALGLGSAMGATR